MQETASDIARLRRAIEAECESLHLAMHGFRTSASHDIINNRYNGIGVYMDELQTLVGEKEASRIAVETYTSVVERPEVR